MIQRLKNQRGMSLIEILIVLGIIAGIMGAILNKVFSAGDKANIKQAQTEIKTLAGYIKLYKQEKGEYPTGDQGLQALVDTGYMEEVPQDPWKNDYVYESPGSHGNKFELYSEGPDDSKEEDNINSWKSE